MKLKKWEALPAFMRTEEVRPYYEILENHRFSLALKRFFDFYASTFMLILLAPVFFVLAVWIRLDSEGPVFYRQRRVTQYGSLFSIYKFRTMVVNADKIGGLVTVSEDPRITRVGKKLRGCRLDELPQLINIWKGEMTFVGTRPEVVKYVKWYTKEMYATLLLPAGVTSEASIEFRDEEAMLGPAKEEEADRMYIEQVLKRKMEWNLGTIKYFSGFCEVRVLFRTLAIVLGK